MPHRSHQSHTTPNGGTAVPLTTSDDAEGNIQEHFYCNQGFDDSHEVSNNADEAIAGVGSGSSTRSLCGRVLQQVVTVLQAWFPFINTFKNYNIRTDFLNDFVGGIIVGILHIPQGLANGILSGLDPVYGLYTSMFPVLVYFFFGTSRHISIGTYVVITLMIRKAVEEFDCNESRDTSSLCNSSENASLTTCSLTNDHISQIRQCKISVAVTVTFLTGLLQVVLGLTRLGFLVNYLPESLKRAFLTSAAVHIATTQIGDMFGISLGQYGGPLKLIYTYITFFKNIHQTNVAALVTCLISMLVIYSVQRWLNPIVKKKFNVPFPIELLVIIVGTLISHYAKFDVRFGVKVVGTIPTGVPAPVLPSMSKLSSLITFAISPAIVSFISSISLAIVLSKKHNYDVDANQEMLAYGLMNTVCSMLNCFVSSGSLSRSLVQEAAGSKTQVFWILSLVPHQYSNCLYSDTGQVAGLVSSCVILVTLLAIASLFYSLPKCILAAIILVNLRPILLQITDIYHLFKKSQHKDLAIWVVTFVAVILTDVDLGLYIGIGFTIFLAHFQRQRMCPCILDFLTNAEIDQQPEDSKVETSASHEDSEFAVDDQDHHLNTFIVTKPSEAAFIDDGGMNVSSLVSDADMLCDHF